MSHSRILEPGQRVRVRAGAPFAVGHLATVEEAPIIKGTPEAAEWIGNRRRVRMREGFGWFYWISFDVPARDEDGTQGVIGGEFDERHLEPIE